MALIYGTRMSKEEVLKRVGDISQLGGVQLLELQDGVERGIRVANFNTGGGLTYTVLLDRGMDIAWTFYKGIGISCRSATQSSSPYFFEPEDFGWLRGFHGGLMNTAGLTYLGAPCRDVSTHPYMQEENLGLHGRASYTPASNILVDGIWENDEYIMWVQGKVREAIVFGDKLALRRKIWSKLGEKAIHIEDEVTNVGWIKSPFMILYHINVGYPIVDASSKLYLPVEKTEPTNKHSEEGLEDWNVFQKPQKDYHEKVYRHFLKKLKDGNSASLLFNEKMNLGVYVKFTYDTLPYFTEWKMMGEGEYVVGMEPGNCFPLVNYSKADTINGGRKGQRDEGTLENLAPGEKRKMVVEIGVVEGRNEIEGIQEYFNQL